MPKGYRTCTTCNETKPLPQFRLQGLGRRNKTCRDCEWRQAEERSKRYALTEAWEQLQRGEE